MITEAQRLERLQGLGGSDIAAIIPCRESANGFLSPWATEVTVWLEKKGRTAPQNESEAMWWGSEEEALIAKRFTELTGKKTQNYNFTIHDGCLLSNLDRLIIPQSGVAAFKREIRATEILEAKTTGSLWADASVVEILENGYEVLDGEAGVPAYYQTQVNHYLGRVATAEKAYVAVKASIPCKGYSRTEFKVYLIKRDDAIIKAQDEYARAWWEKYIVGDKMPEATCVAEAKALWTFSRPSKSVVAIPEVLTALKKLAAAKADIKEAEKRKDEAQTIIENALTTNDTLLGPDGKTTLATWKSKFTTDWEKLARAKGATDEEIKDHTSLHTETTEVIDWEGLAKAKGATDEEIAAAQVSVKRTFLLKNNATNAEYVDAEIAKAETVPAETTA